MRHQHQYETLKPFDKISKEESTNQSRSLFNYKKYLKPALCQEQLLEIKQIFDIFDSEGKGLISPSELLECLSAVGYKAKQSDAYQQILSWAADGQGQVQFDQFLTMLTTKVTSQDSRSDMDQLFSLFDEQKTGYLTVKTLHRLAKEMDIDVREGEIERMFDLVDEDKDGKINQDEFYTYMCDKKDD